MKKHEVRLKDEERAELTKLVRSGSTPARVVRRAQILLKSDGGWSDEEIRAALEVSRQTVHDVRKQCVTEGVERTVNRKPGRKAGEVTKTLDGVAEAHLIAVACSKPPEGQARWTLRLLANRMVELKHVEAVSHETVRSTLKKTNLSPGSSRRGAFHPSKTRRS